MTTYTAEDFALAARRIEAFTERDASGGIDRKHLRAAVAALRLVIAGGHASEASWPDEAALRRWHRQEHERPRLNDVQWGLQASTQSGGVNEPADGSIEPETAPSPGAGHSTGKRG